MAIRNQTILNHFIKDYGLYDRTPNDDQMHVWCSNLALFYSKHHHRPYKPLYDLLMTAREVVEMEKLLND